MSHSGANLEHCESPLVIADIEFVIGRLFENHGLEFSEIIFPPRRCQKLHFGPERPRSANRVGAIVIFFHIRRERGDHSEKNQTEQEGEKCFHDEGERWAGKIHAVPLQLSPGTLGGTRAGCDLFLIVLRLLISSDVFWKRALKATPRMGRGAGHFAGLLSALAREAGDVLNGAFQITS